jgi:DNA replication factor GINS
LNELGWENMAIDFEEMRRIYRMEKSTARLVDVPDDFFTLLHALIDEERKKYFDSLADLNTTRARDFGNLKKLVDEWFVVREKKLLNAVLMAARLEELDNAHMSAEEKKMVEHVYTALMAHRAITKQVLDANSEFVAIGVPSVPQASSPLNERMDALKHVSPENSVVEKEVETVPPSHSFSSSASPARAPAQLADDSLSTPASPVKILSDIPSFVGTDLKEYGPYKPGQVVSLPEKIAQLFVSRKLGENV